MSQPPAVPTDAPPREDEFFIGWLPIPRSYLRRLWPVAVGLLFTAAVSAGLVAAFQRNPGTGQWDTDNRGTFEGIVTAQPYALLHVAGEKPGDPPRTFLLVEEGKFGAGPRVERLLQGKAEGGVRASGTILHRDGRWMLELADGAEGLRPLAEAEERRLPALPRPEPVVVAERTALRGEIIDPKCYLGAMKPGGGKTHKACACLCISGGIPPMFVTRAGNGAETFYLLTTDDGGAANAAVLQFVGDAVEVTGRLERRGDLLLLKLVPHGVQRR
jgi:hypothetical protein